MKTKNFIYTFFAICAVLLFLHSCSGGSTKAIMVGDTIASFSGTDLSGNTFSLASHRGKPVIIRFFLVNCPNCKAVTPVFNKFYKNFRQKGLKIVYINNNATSMDEVKTFVHDLNVEFPVIFDPDGKIAKQYNVKVQPLTLVLSPEHKLLAALLGEVSEAELNELLNPYIQ